MYPTNRRCTIPFMMLCLVLSMSLMACHSPVLAQISVDQGPKDVSVVQGNTAIFDCDLNNAAGHIIYWYYESGATKRYLSIGREVGRSTPLSPALLNRLSVIGDESQEEFTLRIVSVQESDKGSYSCLYAVGNSLHTAGAGILTVWVPPSMQSPVCRVLGISGTTDQFQVDEIVSLYCYTSGGNPTPSVGYYRNGDRVTTLARSIGHQYRLTADDNGVTFTCIMTTPALDGPRNCSVMPLKILPNATILPVASRVEEGTSASFECFGEGTPNIATYRWRVTNVDTGDILPEVTYTVPGNGRQLEIKVMENLELLCTVSVPSGLSGNTTARVHVIQREVLTTAAISTVEKHPSSEPSSASPPVAIIVAVVVLALIAIILVSLTWFMWRRKRLERSKIPIDPKDGYKMSDVRDEYAEIDIPTQNGRDTRMSEADFSETQTGVGLVASNPLYAAPDHRKRVGSAVRSAVDSKQGSLTCSQPDKKPATNNNDEKLPPSITDGTLARLLPAEDAPLYAQPDKPKRSRKSEDYRGSEYLTLPAEEPDEADSGLVYADLALDSSPDKTSSNIEPPSASEKTVYASILT
ncbi:uncharacterized protein LOC110990664 [Acanthaster planci]|uniref:Uncharacterized protein LOC110990664 n=1 Tax=Acanthaster planci TaxID=133434 RepID=A0A8B8A247_ACAPL|nr:uncharacterized protein LOC110990664 [Acanthaster planci]